MDLESKAMTFRNIANKIGTAFQHDQSVFSIVAVIIDPSQVYSLSRASKSL
jgi:hypothetical protein